MIGKMKILGAVFLVMMGINTSLLASVSMSASVNRDQLTINDSLEYKVVVTGTRQNVQINEAFLKDFFVERRASSQSYQLVNNNFSASQIKTFVLRPKQEGEFIIPSLEMSIDGEKVKTNPIKVVVKPTALTNQNSQQNQQGNITNQSNKINQQKIPKGSNKDIFIVANANKSTAYVGEEIIYTITLYRRFAAIEQLLYDNPDIEAITEVLERDPKTYTRVYQGRKYYVQEVDKRALFCYEPGTLMINPATADVQVHFFYGNQRIKSNPLDITILPLPEENKPTEFSGLVGEYQLDTTFGEDVVIQNKPLAVQLNLKGEGNLKQLSEFNVDDTENFKVYPSTITDQISYVNSVKGSRKYEYIVVPKNEGDINLPVFATTYFSPKEKSYVTLKSEQKKVSILSAGEPVLTQEATDKIMQLAQDLKYIKEDLSLQKQYKPFYKTIVAWVVFVINMTLMFMVLFFYLSKSKYWKYIGKLFALKPKDIALQQLILLKKDTGNATIISNIQQILTTYISTVIRKPAKGLTLEDLLEQLTKQNINAEIIAQIKTVIEQCNYMAYSPDLDSAESSEKLCDDAIKIIKKVS